MERFISQFDRKKTNFYSDKSLRMKERPYSVQSGEGRGHEDFGSSFAPSQPSQPVQGKATTSKVKPTTSHLVTRSLELDLSDDSDDELLLGPSLAHKRVVHSKATVSISQEIRFAPNGHEYHPDFLPGKKLPSFKKNNKGSQMKEIIPEGPPTSSFPDPDDSQELFRPISDDLPPRVLPFQHTAKLTREKDAGSSKRTTVRISSPLANKKVYTRQKSVERYVSRKPASPTLHSKDKPPNPIQRQIPRARLVKAGSSIIRDQSPETTPRAGRQPQPFPLTSLSSAHNDNSRASDVFPPRKSAREPSVAKKQNAKVPTSKSKETTNALSRHDTASSPMDPLVKSSLPVKQPLLDPKAPKPKPFPLHKPALTSSDTFDKFPVPSPLASPVRPSSLNKGKGRAPVPLEQEGGIDRLAMSHTVQINGALRPFPMKPQEVKTAPHRSPRSPSGSIRSKRTSDDSDAEHDRKVKRHKEHDPG